MRLTLPQPHVAQRKVLTDTRRFNILRCGRRWGKTFLGLMALAGLSGRGISPFLSRGILSGYPVAWIAPNYKYVTEVWNQARKLFGPLEVKASVMDRRIDYITGGFLEVWSAERGDIARSRKYALIVVDEAAIIKNLREEWNESILPALTDYKGGAIFASTPRGKNAFHEMEQEAKADEENWQVFHFPTWTNPHIPSSEIEMLKRTMPRLSFLQEIQAEYVDTGGVLVRPEYLHSEELPPNARPRAVVMGVDLAISTKETADYTACVTIAQTDDGIHVLGAARARLGFFAAQRFIIDQFNRYRPNVVVVEDVQYQRAMVEALKRERLPVRGVRVVKDKVARFMPLLGAFERDEVRVVPGVPSDFYDELLSFPEGDHDDYVDAFAHAYNALPGSANIQVA